MLLPKMTWVLITGCSPGGIGHALALEFMRRGCNVIASARNPEVLQELREQGMSVVALDVTDIKSIEAAKNEVAKLTGGCLDILINNAGRTHTIPALDIEIEDVRQTYETNVFGPMFTIKSFIELLIPARGLIINISSTSSVVPYLFGSVYSSTKGAINTYSRALRLELKPLNVRVMVAMTGTVKSNIASRTHRVLPLNSLYQPVQDVFQRRLTFSQNNATMDTTAYAKKLVSAALKGNGWYGGLFGASPDWFWAGGMSTSVWFMTTYFPPWLSEGLVGWFFGVAKWGKVVAAALKAKQA